jgi:dethiobiotin synthetase
MKQKPLFITGIGTNVGKTIVSAVLAEQLNADYWKPVQAGDLSCTDSDKIGALISNKVTVIHPERFKLTLAASPHKAAEHDGITISPGDFHIPVTANRLLIEGAGGLFVPLSADFLMTGLMARLETDIVLVIKNYLGCINHTLLSLYALKNIGLPLKHVVFNGDFDKETKAVISSHLPDSTSRSQLPEFLSIDKHAIKMAPIQIINNK